jgi:hypothetical protein
MKLIREEVQDVRFIVEEIMHENRPVYKISFSPKKNRENSYESYLMIDKVTFAIITLQIEAINSNSLWAILHQSKWKINFREFDDTNTVNNK